MGVDAKHSFEDKILPVEEVYRRWSERIALDDLFDTANGQPPTGSR